MKYILFCLILISSNIVLAQMEKIEVPSGLKDSTITTTLKNGKKVIFNGNEWMVVRRHPKLKKVVRKKPQYKIQEASTEECCVTTKEVVVKESIDPSKNRIRLIGGVGPQGLSSEERSNLVKVKNKIRGVGGIGYDRMLDRKWSAGGQALSNGTFLLNVGFDF